MRHFLASFLVSILLAIFLGHNIVLWAIIGGAVGTLIDLDHFLLLALYGRKFPRVRNVSVKNLNTVNLGCFIVRETNLMDFLVNGQVHKWVGQK